MNRLAEDRLDWTDGRAADREKIREWKASSFLHSWRFCRFESIPISDGVEHEAHFLGFDHSLPQRRYRKALRRRSGAENPSLREDGFILAIQMTEVWVLMGLLHASVLQERRGRRSAMTAVRNETFTLKVARA